MNKTVKAMRNRNHTIVCGFKKATAIFNSMAKKPHKMAVILAYKIPKWRLLGSINVCEHNSVKAND